MARNSRSSSSRSSSSSRKSNFVYKRRSKESAEKRLQGGDIKDPMFIDEVLHIPMFTPADGENKIRILPPGWEEPEHYGVDLYIHYGVGPENLRYLDLSRHGKGDDPIAEELFIAQQEEADDETIRSLRSTRRILVYIIDLKHPEKGVHLYAMPQTVDNDIMESCRDPETGEIDAVDDPDEGYDIFLKREGTGRNTSYTVKLGRQKTSFDITSEIAEVITTYPLPDVLRFYDYDHIKKAFSGRSTSSTSSDDGRHTTVSNRNDDHDDDHDDQMQEELQNVTVDDVRMLQGSDLDDFVEKYGLDLDLASFKEDADLQDAIIETLGLKDDEDESQDDDEDSSDAEDSRDEEDTRRSRGTSSRLAGLRNRNKR